MDQVILTRRQLRTMAEKGIDYVVTAANADGGLIFVEPLQYIGQGKGKWLTESGRVREGGKL